MLHPIHVTFCGLDRSETAVEAIERSAEKLETHGHRVQECHARLERHGHQVSGNPFEIRLFLGLIGRRAEELQLEASATNGDLYVAIQDAFTAMEKQLEHATRPPRHRPGHHGDLAALVGE